MNHGDVDHCLTSVRKALVIFAEATITSQPTKGPLHHPAARQEHETFDSNRSQDGLQNPPTGGLSPFYQLASVAAVGPDDFQTWQTGADFIQDQLGPITILDVGRMNDDGQKQTQGVDQKVPLPAGYFFSGIIAPGPSLFGRLYRLAVQDSSAGLRVPVLTFPNGHDPPVMDVLPDAGQPPTPVVTV